LHIASLKGPLVSPFSFGSRARIGSGNSHDRPHEFGRPFVSHFHKAIYHDVRNCERASA
jgi:hypothetical protein